MSALTTFDPAHGARAPLEGAGATIVLRLRAARTLLAMVLAGDPLRALFAFSPFFPLAAGLAYASARHLLRALPGNDSAAIVVAGALFTAAWFGSVVLGRAGSTMRVRIVELTRYTFERRLMDAVLRMPGVDHLEDPEYLDHLEILRTRTMDVVNAPRMLGWLVDGTGGLLVSVGLLLTVRPALLLVVLAGAPAVVLNGRAQNRVEAVRQAEAARSRRALHLYDIATTAAGAKEVRVSGLADELLARYRTEWKTTDRALLGAEARAALVAALAWLMGIGAFGVGLWILVDGVRSGAVDTGDIFLTLGVMTLVVGQVSGAANGVTSFRRTIRVIEHLVWIEQRASAARAASDAPGGAPVVGRLEAGIRLEGVGFRYPTGSSEALDDVTLTLPAGSVVAIVGDNGAGKSTLVKLLFGLYEPTRGRILVDGTDLAHLPITAWRARTSACFQDHLNLELTARESVGCGSLADLHDDGLVAGAIARAAATDVLARLPAGLDTQVGTRLGGQDLSGGEWQKLAISRAMMRTAPLLLALDEPTSALDPLAEKALFERYAAVARGLAADLGTVTVLVSHRFSTVRMADLIVVLQDGRVVESGPHDQLVARGGLYAELYGLQARYYS